MNYSDLIEKFFLAIDKLVNNLNNNLNEEEKNTIRGSLVDALFLNFISLLAEESAIKNSLTQSQLTEKELETKIQEIQQLINNQVDKYLPILSRAAKITLNDFIDQQRFRLSEIKHNELLKIVEDTLSS